MSVNACEREREREKKARRPNAIRVLSTASPSKRNDKYYLRYVLYGCVLFDGDEASV